MGIAEIDMANAIFNKNVLNVMCGKVSYAEFDDNVKELITSNVFSEISPCCKHSYTCLKMPACIDSNTDTLALKIVANLCKHINIFSSFCFVLDKRKFVIHVFLKSVLIKLREIKAMNKTMMLLDKELMLMSKLFFARIAHYRMNRDINGRRIPWKSRLCVFKRDKYTCRYCGWQNGVEGNRDRILSVDHIIPVSHGGTAKIDNLCTCCLKCNLAKHASFLPEDIREFKNENT